MARRFTQIGQMKKTVSITLEENDWGQIIDGLTCRAEQYEETAVYYEGGYVEGEVFVVQDANEARDLAAWYRRLVKQIRSQWRNGCHKPAAAQRAMAVKKSAK